MAVLAILKRLFGRKRAERPVDRVAPPPPAAPFPATREAPPPFPPETAAREVVESSRPSSGPAVSPLLEPTPAPPAPLPPAPEVEAVDEDEEPAEDEDEADVDDPTVGRLEPLRISLPETSQVERDRDAAERVALSGPQTITPNDPAGPGSLAETLMRLETRGLVTSRVVEDDEGGFRILYEPATPPVP